jgi:hypothetical protein
MPSARTSAGNKEYEYKANKEHAASLQQPGNRRKTGSVGDAVVAAALRHVIERKAVRACLSRRIHMTIASMWRFRIWTAIHPNGFT